MKKIATYVFLSIIVSIVLGCFSSPSPRSTTPKIPPSKKVIERAREKTDDLEREKIIGMMTTKADYTFVVPADVFFKDFSIISNFIRPNKHVLGKALYAKFNQTRFENKFKKKAARKEVDLKYNEILRKEAELPQYSKPILEIDVFFPINDKSYQNGEFTSYLIVPIKQKGGSNIRKGRQSLFSEPSFSRSAGDYISYTFPTEYLGVQIEKQRMRFYLVDKSVKISVAEEKAEKFFMNGTKYSILGRSGRGYKGKIYCKISFKNKKGRLNLIGYQIFDDQGNRIKEDLSKLPTNLAIN